MALPQPLHIFQKDLRHLWPETLVTLVFFAIFAFGTGYDASGSQFGALLPFGLFLLRLMMPITWLVLIARLIQDEPLVGDRQFWTSRPYHWATLLAAKILYLIVFLYLPFLLMQVYLLQHAGLWASDSLGPLFNNLLLLTVFIVVPITVIAAVTSGFIWVLLSALGAVIYIGIIFGVLAFFSLTNLRPPSFSPVLYAIVILLPMAVLVFQYATRKTFLSRVLLLASPLVVMLLIMVTPTGALVRQGYPVASGTDAPKLAELPDQFRPKAPQPGKLVEGNGTVHLALPFLTSGIDAESNYVVEGTSLTVDAPGLHWVSPYKKSLLDLAQPLEINAGSRAAVAQVNLPIDIFDKLRSVPSDVHLSMAAEHFKAGKPETWTATDAPFSVPGNGVCHFDKEDPASRPVVCNYPFKSPELNIVTAPVTTGNCGDGVQTQLARTQLKGSPSWLDFNPVISVPMNFQARQQDPQQQQAAPLRLCPGAKMAFIEAKSVGRVRLEVDEKALVLNNFALRLADHKGTAAGQAPQGGPSPEQQQ